MKIILPYIIGVALSGLLIFWFFAYGIKPNPEFIHDPETKTEKKVIIPNYGIATELTQADGEFLEEVLDRNFKWERQDSCSYNNISNTMSGQIEDLRVVLEKKIFL